MSNCGNEIIILGGGLAGLSAGYVLTNAGRSVKVFERDRAVGGLSKTIVNGEFRFDLGGHRFVTQDTAIDVFVKNLMSEELVSVPRSSKIYLRGKYFDYPLRPLNAVFGLGLPTTARILADYGAEAIKKLIRKKQSVSLEDWVVANFGRTMFTIYFKEYSEKVWSIDCARISAEWVEKRIKGLSLAQAVKNAFLKSNGKDLPTLVDKFLYPRLGIGRIADRLGEEIQRQNEVFTGTSVERIHHADSMVDSIVVRSHLGTSVVRGEQFIATIPVTKLVRVLNPSPPQDILDAAARLRFRDLVVVAVMLDKERITSQTWLYVPEQKIPFGRIHEPTNWSRKMAPAGKTLLVMEFFSFRGDSIWRESDEALIDISVDNLVRLGLIKRQDVIDGMVVKVPQAYPLFEIGYRSLCDMLHDYLGRFRNLHIAGRNAMFRYYNMDVAMQSGIEAAERAIGRGQAPDVAERGELVTTRLI
jgi:protoporphyrinogen oxidase